MEIDSSKKMSMVRDLLTDKVVVITGASRGIGAATAHAFAAAGAKVVLAARDAAALDNVAGQIRSAGGEARAVPTDVREPDAVQALVRSTVDTYGRLDIAFNNAAGGGHLPTPLAEVAVADFDSAYQITLRGIFLAMKYEIPAMLASGGGSIVNMASTAGLRGLPGLAAYVASKHGVVGLSKSAALDYAGQGIRINVVAPGTILTHHLERAGKPVQEQFARSIPAQRLGTPEEVAAAVVWLSSPAASFITGAVITIDGGKLAAGA